MKNSTGMRTILDELYKMPIAQPKRFKALRLGVSRAARHMHYSMTDCGARNCDAFATFKAMVIAHGLKLPAPSADRSWVQVSTDHTCDMDEGEKRIADSSRIVSNVEECKKACKTELGCQSVTYFTNSFCLHFSTPCTNTVRLKMVKETWQLVSDTRKLRGG